MPKRGLDANASFRHPVATATEGPKIMVDCDILEALLEYVKDYQFPGLRKALYNARIAHQAHRRGVEP